MGLLVRLVVRNSEIPHPDGAFSDLPEALWAAGRGLAVQFFYDADSGTVHLDSVVHGRTVVIDPGHGGKDRGGHGVMGYYEAEGALGIALVLASLLRSAGARVVLTRAQDETVPLEERLSAVRGERPDVFISLHTKGLPTGGGLRPAVIYNYRRPLASFHLAGCVAAEMSTYGGMPPFLRRFRLRGRDIDGYNGLLLGSGVPAVVIECASHHYPEQERLLLNRDYLKNCAWAIYRGLCRHFGAEFEDLAGLTDELRLARRPAGPPAVEAGPPRREPEPPALAKPAAPVPQPALAVPFQAALVQPGQVTVTPLTGPHAVGSSRSQVQIQAPSLAFAGGQLFQVAPPGSAPLNIGVSDRAAEAMAGKLKDTGMPPTPPEFVHWPQAKPAGSAVKPHG